MIKTLQLKFGPRPAEAPLQFEVGALTVFVGPNNSGKSLALQEIERLTEQGPAAPTLILGKIELQSLLEADILSLFETRKNKAASKQLPEGQMVVSKVDPIGGVKQQFQLNPTQMARTIADGHHLNAALRHLVSLFTVRLDGKTRLALVEQKQSGDLLQHPQNHLMALFQDPKALARMRQLTHEAFGLYFVIDPTHVGHLRVRMARRPPVDAAEEQSWDERARLFHQEARQITALSDGVKAYTGLIAAVLSVDFRVMLVDEPEAFLHPPLSRRLGRTLAQLAADRRGNVLASTHSPDFVMGAIQAGGKVNIVRLTYKSEIATARLLSSSDLQAMMRDPLLRSTGVLGALFHEGAVVCEGDSDRAFYQELNERLLAEGASGADSCLFLNAHNKQSIRRIVRPLRKMGIPAAGIVDIDFIKDPDAKELLHAAFVPQALVNAFGVLKGTIEKAFTNKGVNMKDGGIDLLDAPDREAAQSFIGSLAEYGVFVVPKGTLESWLSHLGVAGPKKDWLPTIFEKMGTDPSDASYLRPGNGDVWAFMREVAAWIGDPKRKGMGA